MSWLGGLILALIVVVAITATPIIRKNRREYQRTGKYPKGHYVGLGLALGIAVGLPIGIAMDNIALGPAIGLPIGLAIGTAWEKEHEDELRSLTEREEKLRRRVVVALVGLFLAGIAALLFALLIAR